jgi:hypothetical protein
VGRVPKVAGASVNIPLVSEERDWNSWGGGSGDMEGEFGEGKVSRPLRGSNAR